MPVYETIEWANVWVEHQGETDRPRALLVGDSITQGALHLVKELVGEKMYVDALTTSYALDNPDYLSGLDGMLAHNRYDVIHFNNGLHGFHLPAEAYEALYGKAVEHLLEKAPGAKLVLGLSTPISNGEHTERMGADNEIVLARNGAVRRIAGRYGLPVNDSYSLVAGIPGIRATDSYHYLEEGYRRIAGQMAAYLK